MFLFDKKLEKFFQTLFELGLIFFTLGIEKGSEGQKNKKQNET